MSAARKVLVRNEPLASIIAEGLEGYASGRFQLRAEVKRFFEQFPESPKNAKGEVSNEHVNRILSRVIYAGYIQSDIMGCVFASGTERTSYFFGNVSKKSSNACRKKPRYRRVRI